MLYLVGWAGQDGDIASWARAEGLTVLDMWPTVRGYLVKAGRDFPSLWVAPPIDNHPNEEGHAIIGRYLAEAILEQGLLPLR